MFYLTKFFKPGQQHCVTATKPRKPLVCFSNQEFVLKVKQALSFSLKKKKFVKKDRFCFGKPTKAWHTMDTDFPAREFVFYCNLLLHSTFCPNLRLNSLKGSPTLPTNEGLPSWLINSEGKKLFRFHHMQNVLFITCFEKTATVTKTFSTFGLLLNLLIQSTSKTVWNTSRILSPT